MALETFKFIIRPVLINKDNDGNIVGELLDEPVTVYGIKGLTEWAQVFDTGRVASLNAQITNGHIRTAPVIEQPEVESG